MQEHEIYSKLTRLFRDNFDDQSIVISSHTTAHDITGWDSTAHVNLIVAIEEEFRIQLQTAEIESIKDVGEMVYLIGQKTTGNPTRTLQSSGN